MQSHEGSKKLNEQDLGIVTGGVSKHEKATCPKCGSSNTFHNKIFNDKEQLVHDSFVCTKCHYSF